MHKIEDLPTIVIEDGTIYSKDKDALIGAQVTVTFHISSVASLREIDAETQAGETHLEVFRHIVEDLLAAEGIASAMEGTSYFVDAVPTVRGGSVKPIRRAFRARPPWDSVVEIMRGAYLRCECGELLQDLKTAEEHWDSGHFDTVALP